MLGMRWRRYGPCLRFRTAVPHQRRGLQGRVLVAPTISECVRAPAGAEVIDEYSGIEVDAHYAARRCVTSSSGVTTWGCSAVTKVFSSASLVTKKSHSTALLRIRMSFEWAKRFLRDRTRGSRSEERR